MTLPSAHSSTLVIDFSDLQHTDKHPSFDFDLKHFIEWVKFHPRRGNIHVYVRSGIVSGANRKLQTRLQALGCRVTTKVSCK